jgi:hypothetical protein
MLYYENPANIFTAWIGQDIGDVRHPIDIETKWTAQELATINLYAPARDDVPEGKQIASSTVQRVAGVVKFVDTYEDIVIAADDVSAERDRRIALGMPVQPTGVAAPFVMQTRDPDDFRNINGLSTAAIVLKGLDPTRVISVRDAADVQHDLTLDQVIELGLQVQAGVSAIYEKSWALKAMEPIPLDYADNAYWT